MLTNVTKLLKMKVNAVKLVWLDPIAFSIRAIAGWSVDVVDVVAIAVVFHLIPPMP